MIRRTVKIQLAAFVILSVLGVAYVGANYVGFNIGKNPYTVRLMLAKSGGIFPNAEVTERGVTVGRVSSMQLVNGGVEVSLRIDQDKKIPAQVHATVANLSAVGEQYVDLEPQTDTGPFLQDGSVIPQSQTTTPLDDATLLVDLDQLVNSVDTKHLAVVIDELGKAFNELGPSLQGLIDNGNKLATAAIESLPSQLALINDGRRVMDTQNDVATELKSWAASFASFADQLRVSDPDLRGVLDRGIPASRELRQLLLDNQSVLPTLLGNLITFNQIQAVRIPQVRATLELFPSLTAGGFYVTPGDGTAHFGMVNDNNSPPCTVGYSSTKVRGNSGRQDWGGPANLNAYCQDPHPAASCTTDCRGSRLVPRPDAAQVTNADPYPGPRYGRSSSPTLGQQTGSPAAPAPQGQSPSRGSPGAAPPGSSPVVPVPYNPITGLLTGTDGKQYQLGYNGPLAPIFGSSSWEWLLLAPTMR